MAGEITRDAVAAAAVQCFARYGPQRTSMADIADAAGISRQSIYRTFATRGDLLEYVITQRITAMGERVARSFEAFGSLEDALVEGSIIALKTGQADELFVDLVEKGTEHSIEQFLFRSTGAVKEMMLGLWTPLLREARAQGQLDPELTDDEIVAWIQQVHTILIMLDERDAERQRFMLRKFLVPSLLGRRASAPA